MKKIAIFVEGQTEQIFATRLLYQFYGYGNVEIVGTKSRGKKHFVQLKAPKPHYTYYFLIVDIGGEPDDFAKSTVLSDMLENYKNMKDKGYVKLMGLKDLYPQKREDKKKIVEAMQKEIIKQNISPETCKVMLAIMEIEAWFMADPNLFSHIDKSLTPEHIREELKYDLLQDDPELVYNHPAGVIEKIYELAGKHYKKREKDAYKIVESLNYEHLCLDVREQNKITSFFLFLAELENL
jgi:hypothetical protein